MGVFTSNSQFKIDEAKDKIVVLLGKTGVGKSSFINSITHKKNCKIGKNSKSCTKELKQVDLTFNGYNYYFVDTPGLDDGKGDEKNISKLGDLREYPRICTFLICLKFDDLKLSNSLKRAIIIFMDIFPSMDFWSHVIIIRTWSIRGKKFEKYKNQYKGTFLEGIKKDPDLTKYMKEKNIKLPENLLEFYVDSDEDDLDEETLDEFKNILVEIRKKYPLYKEVKIEDKEIVNEEKKEDLLFLHIVTYRYLTFTDFNDQKHTTVNKINEERYNLNCIKPSLTEVKRYQETNPRGPLCWKYQYKTHYNLVKIYCINDKQIREEYELNWKWEKKDNDVEGEDYRDKLQEDYDVGCGEA